MKLKLNNNEMLTLAAFVSQIANSEQVYENMAVVDEVVSKLSSNHIEFTEAGKMRAKLLKVMMQRLAVDLQVKVMYKKKEFRLSWHPERAMAFWCVCFPLLKLKPFQKPEMIYQAVLLQKICNAIHQQYA